MNRKGLHWGLVCSAVAMGAAAACGGTSIGSSSGSTGASGGSSGASSGSTGASSGSTGASSGSSGPGSGSSGPGGGSSSGSGGSTSGSAGDDGGSSSGASSGPTTPYTGYLAVLTNGPYREISGYFIGTPGGGASTGSASPGGMCSYTPPPPPSDGGLPVTGTGSTTVAVSAGAITVKDGTATVATLPFVDAGPGAVNTYLATTSTSPGLTWDAGDTLAVAAAGDVVSAFTANINTGADFAGVTPALSYTTPIVIPRNADFTVTWTPGSGDTVELQLSATNGTADDGSIDCTVPDSDGTITVPSALLGNFTANDKGSALLVRSWANTATGANVTVYLSAVSPGPGGSVTFQ